MTDKTDLLDRLTGRRPAQSPDEEADACADHGAYGFLRGARDRAVMIDFRLKSGCREAFPYATLERVSFDPAAGLTLRFLGGVVRLTGRNLAVTSAAGVNLVEAIHRHRVAWVREGDEVRGAFLPADAVVVTLIDVRTPDSRP